MLVGLGVLDMVEGEKHMIVGTKRKEDLGVVTKTKQKKVRRPYKALSPDICILCMKHGESADHIFLHCSLTIGLWHKLFQLTKMDWVPPRSILDMMYIKFNGFGSSKRGIALWQAANIALIRIVWWERNARIFEDKARNSEYLWDSIHFLASLRGLPLMCYNLIG